MGRFTLSQAEKIIAAALAKASEIDLKPLTIAVLDSGGHLVALARQDGASIMRPQIAHGKAFGALAVGAGSRWLDNDAQNRPHFIQALNGLAGGSIVPVAGGVLVRDGVNGEILGAVGVTGDTSDNDEICAVAGVEAVELTPDCG